MLPHEVIEKYGFAKRFLAVDRLGNPVLVDSPKAVAFCMMGAMLRSDISNEQRHLLGNSISQEKGTFISVLNDYPYMTREIAIELLKEAEEKIGLKKTGVKNWIIRFLRKVTRV